MENVEILEQELFGEKNTSIAKDLKLNFRKYFGQGALSKTEVALVGYSLSKVVNLPSLDLFSREFLLANGYTEEQLLEAVEIAGLMGMLNTYYKFKNFVNSSSDYLVAGLRMNALAKHSLSKVEFELLALAHSLHNACEFCVKAHEQELRTRGVEIEKIHDVARFTGVLKGIYLL